MTTVYKLCQKDKHGRYCSMAATRPLLRVTYTMGVRSIPRIANSYLAAFPDLPAVNNYVSWNFYNGLPDWITILRGDADVVPANKAIIVNLPSLSARPQTIEKFWNTSFDPLYAWHHKNCIYPPAGTIWLYNFTPTGIVDYFDESKVKS